MENTSDTIVRCKEVLTYFGIAVLVVGQLECHFQDLRYHLSSRGI